MRSGNHSRGAIALFCLPWLGLLGCGGSTPPPEPRPAIFYPGPPQEPRIQFLTAFTGEKEIVKESGPSLLEQIAGSEDDDDGTRKVIAKPFGVDIHDGAIYVCDTGLQSVDIFDLQERTFEQWRPDGAGQLLKPINCHVGPDDGRLYVADPMRGEVVVFGPDRQFEFTIGGGPDRRPTDVFTTADHIYIAEVESQQVQVYSKSTRELVREIPGLEPDSASRLYAPTNIWVEGDRLYVTNFGAWVVKVFELDGTYERTVGSYGVNVGQFARPKGLAVDREGILYVVDAAFENIQMFNSEGMLLMYFGGTYQGPGGMWLPAQVTIDYDNVGYFEDLVDPAYRLEYLILVTNQFGPDKVNVYGRVLPRGQTDAP